MWDWVYQDLEKLVYETLGRQILSKPSTSAQCSTTSKLTKDFVAILEVENPH